MQKMIVIDGKEELDGYEFLHFSLATEAIDGLVHTYNVVICKDPEGYLEMHPIRNVRFL